jgi:hypothetical protein
MMRQSRVITAAAGVLLLAGSYVAMAAKSGKAVKSDVVWTPSSGRTARSRGLTSPNSGVTG